VQVVQDLENDLQLWFQRKGVDWVLLRPDRFVAAAGTRDDAVRQLHRFCDQVLPQMATNPGAAMAPPSGEVIAVA
jgi:3-(3-hydroxy-phenyl)propionate hydroxylase